MVVVLRTERLVDVVFVEQRAKASAEVPHREGHEDGAAKQHPQDQDLNP